MTMYPYNTFTTTPTENINNTSKTVSYTIKKHKYDFNTPNNTDVLASEIVNILVNSILSSHDKKLT